MMMINFRNLLMVSFGFLLACSPENNEPLKRIDAVEALISQMSVEEKVGQMAQVTLDVVTQGDDIYSSDEPVQLDMDSVRKAIQDYHIGSLLNTANNRAMSIEKWHEIVNGIQHIATKETRLKIPVIYGVDATHGASYTVGATMFPQEIAQAATWNRELVKKAAQITAYEVRASCIHWNFSPVLDLGFDPRWPRLWETFGEDPYLCSEMGVQVIDGYQGEEDDLKETAHVAACLKHFLGYSAAESGKDRTPADIPELYLREYHLPAFKKAIEEGAASIMINSGIINGQPVHANHEILTTLLKEELGFQGMVVSDWSDIENLHTRDHVAASHKEAIKIAVNAGIDMSMVPYHYQRFCTLLTELVKEGEVPMSRIDDAVRRVLNTKYDLGLFDMKEDDINSYPKFGSAEFQKTAYVTASESITLLKNKGGILPLKKGLKILVAGPNGNNMRTLNGGWTYSWQGEKVHEFAEAYHTFYEAIRNEFGEKNVRYCAGVEYKMDGNYYEEQNVDIEAAVKAAQNTDVIVLCLGENSYTEKRGDLNDLAISPNQIALAKALEQTGIPIILVLNEGRPRIIHSFEPGMEAVLQTYLCGNYAGDALADILSGDVNPSGKLPYTYPMFSNSLIPYHHKPSEETLNADGTYDANGGFYPQWEFGYGLSYTRFEYANLKVSKKEFGPQDNLSISVDVTNVGNRTGKEVVQLYSTDKYASHTQDVKRLRRFKKVELHPGEKKEIVFSIQAKDLAFSTGKGNWLAEKGDFILMTDKLKTTISLNATMHFKK